MLETIQSIAVAAKINEIHMTKMQKRVVHGMAISLGLLLATSPVYAAEFNVGKKVDTVTAWVTTIAKGLSLICVLGMGVACAFGKASWKTAGQVLLGATIVYGAAEVVELLIKTTPAT